MPARPARYDQYGRPLPTLTAAPVPSREESAANLRQRYRLRDLLTTLEQRYPELLRPEVTADVTIAFKVIEGTIQDDLSVGIVLHYRED
jgi:hypothetical protein